MTECSRTPHGLNSSGYGQVWHQGKNHLHHRLVYCEHNGVTLEDIAGKVVRHKCDQPWCVNPLHLEIGTQKDNAQDMVQRGRHNPVSFPGESHPGAKLTEAQVHAIRLALDSGATCAALGRQYGVDRTTIGKIKKGTNWRCT